MRCRYCARPMLAATTGDYCSKVCADRHAWYGGVPEDVRRAAARRAAPAPFRAAVERPAP